MKVGWLADPGNTDGTGIGGAEMTATEFRLAAPGDVRVRVVRRDELEAVRDCDVVCCFNVALYPEGTLGAVKDKPVVRYWSDVAPHGDVKLTQWFVERATNVFCSPLHFERFPWLNGHKVDHHLIPPPVDLQRFRDAAERSQGRAGAVSVSAWRGWGKTPYLTQEWARKNGVKVDFFGAGQCAPEGSETVLYSEMPDLLAGYETFVFLPTALEPFCRVVAEAHAAGCEIVTNRLVGALHWLENDVHAIDRAPQTFWDLVLKKGS